MNVVKATRTITVITIVPPPTATPDQSAGGGEDENESKYSSTVSQRMFVEVSAEKVNRCLSVTLIFCCRTIWGPIDCFGIKCRIMESDRTIMYKVKVYKCPSGDVFSRCNVCIKGSLIGQLRYGVLIDQSLYVQ